MLVTGATGGIGQAIVRALHARGATVVVSGRRRDVLERLAASWRPGRGARGRSADAGRGGARWSRRADIDVLVANAALPASGRLDSFTGEEIDRALDVNLRAPMQLARALCRRCSSAARAISCSSRRWRARSRARARPSTARPSSGCAASDTRSNEELRGTGVGVTTVFPGFIREAGMFADSGVKLPRGVGTRTPEDVAACRDLGHREGPRRDRRRAALARPPARGCSGSRRAWWPRSTAARRRTRWRGRSPRASATSARPGRRRRRTRLPRERGDQLREPLRLVLRHERARVLDPSRRAFGKSRASRSRQLSREESVVRPQASSTGFSNSPAACAAASSM